MARDHRRRACTSSTWFRTLNSPDDPGGSRAYEFAQRWAASGHKVTLLAGNLNHKTLSTITSPTVSPLGVTVVRVRTYNKIRGSYVRRIANFLSFAFGAILKGTTIPRVDVVYASSTPLTTGVAGLIVYLIRGRDLCSDSRSLARIRCRRRVLKRGLVVRIIESAERFLYSRADTLVALSAGIQKGIIERGGAAGKVVLVPNGMDDWRSIYRFGRLRTSHWTRTSISSVRMRGSWTLEQPRDASGVCTNPGGRPRPVFDHRNGDHRDTLRTHAETLGITNVVFHGPVPKKQVLGYLAASHVCVLCTWPHPFLGTVLQNKIFDYMAAARPVVAAVHGELLT